MRRALLARDPVELRDVVVKNPGLFVLAQRLCVCLEQLLRIRPGRIAVWKVIRPHQATRIQHVRALECYPVVLEGRVYVFAKILTWQLRELRHVQPIAMTVVSMVHPIHEVWNPSGVGLDAGYLELGMTLEDAAQD